MERLKVASLFSGGGGKDLGMQGGFAFLDKTYERNPVKIVFANDINEFACKIYKKNIGVNIINKDIRKIKSEDVPEHDILTGGFPCVTFSIVAQNPKRLGYKSEKGQLFREMIRILRDKKPKGFIAENVEGILSANEGEAFPLILKEFRKSGYNVNYKILDAANYGVPQYRKRVFIIGFKKSLDITPTFPNPTTENKKIPLKKVLIDDGEINSKYEFSERAIKGLERARKKKPNMNKGRDQDINEPCSTVGAHLKKMSLNSTDPVLKTGKRSYRRFSPREVARIQSFPETYELFGTQHDQYNILGNAIPPVMMWHLTRELLNKL